MLSTPGPVSFTRQYTPISIPVQSRGFLTGQTGSGKSTLARLLLADKAQLLVVDPKGEFYPYQAHTVTSDYRAIPQLGDRMAETGEAVVWRPPVEDHDPRLVSDVLLWAFERTNTYVYIDEVTAVCPNANLYPLYLRAIITQGRSRSVGCLCATQRPAYIPRFVISEAECYYVFRLTQPDDNAAMAAPLCAPGQDMLTVRRALSHHHGRYTYYWRCVLYDEPAAEYELELH